MKIHKICNIILVTMLLCVSHLSCGKPPLEENLELSIHKVHNGINPVNLRFDNKDITVIKDFIIAVNSNKGTNLTLKKLFQYAMQNFYDTFEKPNELKETYICSAFIPEAYFNENELDKTQEMKKLFYNLYRGKLYKDFFRFRFYKKP